MGAGDHVCILTDDDLIQVWSDGGFAPKITYTSASNFKTETAHELQQLGTGAIASIRGWPFVLSGAADTTLLALVP